MFKVYKERYKVYVCDLFMAYGKRYSRRRFRKRSYGRYGRYSRRRYRYPKSTRVRATYALRKARGVGRSIYRLRKKFDFQRYYNSNDCTYYIKIESVNVENKGTRNSTGNQALVYRYYPLMMSSSNVMPFWIQSTGVNNTGLGLVSMNEGIKPGQTVSTTSFPSIQGGRFRCRNCYCRWNFKWAVASVLAEGGTKMESLKVRFCAFTLYNTSNTTTYSNSVQGLGNLDYSPIGPGNNNSYFNDNYINILGEQVTPETYKFNSPLLMMKSTGSTKLKKIYDKVFTLNRLKTERTIKVNCFKNSIMKFDNDYVPANPRAGYSVYQWPFQQIYFCVMIDPSIVISTVRNGQVNENQIAIDNGYLYINNQNLIIYYDT